MTFNPSSEPEADDHLRLTRMLGRIICGDNVEVLSQFPNDCIDLVVTSPPYDNLRTYGGHFWNFEALAAQLTRILKPGGVIVWVVADATIDGSETLTSMRQAIHFKDVCGLNVHDTMIYASDKPPLTHNRYEQAWEYMFVLSKGKPVSVNLLRTEKIYHDKRKSKNWHRYADGSFRKNGVSERPIDKPRGNIWHYRTGGGKSTNDDYGGHPAIFPDLLARDHVQSWSNPGDIVLDPFSGSGTTCKAAKELNRMWCGVEINPEYCEIAERRLRQEYMQLEATP